MAETRYGDLCGNHTGTDSALMAVFACFQDDAEGLRTQQAQTGYMIWRVDDAQTGEWTTDTLVYTEISDYEVEGDFVIKKNLIAGIPQEYTTHTYKIQYDAQDDLLYNYYDGPAYAYDVPLWNAEVFRFASWQTEIDGCETDMPGTHDIPCEFDDCQYMLVGQSFTTAGFDAGTCDSIVNLRTVLYPSEWRLQIDKGNSSFMVWDESPGH